MQHIPLQGFTIILCINYKISLHIRINFACQRVGERRAYNTHKMFNIDIEYYLRLEQIDVKYYRPF